MEGNGDGVPLVVLGKRGRLRVRYDAESPEVTLDVMLVQDRWRQADAGFRDEKDEVPPGRLGDYQAASVQFVEELLKVAPGTMSWAEASHFMAVVRAENQKLKDFFADVSGDRRASSATSEVIFSEGPVDID